MGDKAGKVSWHQIMKGLMYRGENFGLTPKVNEPGSFR